MLHSFYISFKNKEFDSSTIKHIQYNIHKRLKERKYISYRWLSFDLYESESELPDSPWDNKETARINWLFDPAIVPVITEREGIVALYGVVFNALERLWTENGWDINDLLKIHSAIKAENYVSNLVYGKSYWSPGRIMKADLYCELYPGHTEYFFRYSDKGQKTKRKMMFLKGDPDPGGFLDWFTNRGWRGDKYFLMSDDNEEIFYVFNSQDGSFSVEFRPRYRSLEECENFVSAFQAGISHQERLRLMGLPYLQ